MQLEFVILKKENRFIVEQMSNKRFVTTPVKGKGGNIATWCVICLIWKRINYFSIVEEGVQDDIQITVRNAHKSHLWVFFVEYVTSICPQLPSAWSRKHGMTSSC